MLVFFNDNNKNKQENSARNEKIIKSFRIHLIKSESPVAFKYFFLVNLPNVGHFPKLSVIGIFCLPSNRELVVIRLIRRWVEKPCQWIEDTRMDANKLKKDDRDG